MTAVVASRPGVLAGVSLPPPGTGAPDRALPSMRSVLGLAFELDGTPGGHLWLQAGPAGADGPVLVASAAVLATTVDLRVTALLDLDAASGRPAPEVAEQAMRLVLRTGARFGIGLVPGAPLPTVFEEHWRSFRPTTGIWRHASHADEAAAIGAARDHLALDEDRCEAAGSSPSDVLAAFRQTAEEGNEAVLVRGSGRAGHDPVPGFDATVVRVEEAGR